MARRASRFSSSDRLPGFCSPPPPSPSGSGSRYRVACPGRHDSISKLVRWSLDPIVLVERYSNIIQEQRAMESREKAERDSATTLFMVVEIDASRGGILGQLRVSLGN